MPQYLGPQELLSMLTERDIPTKNLTSYGELVEGFLDMLESAKEEAYVASRYYEPLIGSKLVEKFAVGTKLHILDGNPSGISLSERIRQVARVSTRSKELLTKFLESPNVTLETAELEFSLAVMDRKNCGFEVTDPRNQNEFNYAIQFTDEKMATTLIETFHKIQLDANVRKSTSIELEAI